MLFDAVTGLINAIGSAVLGLLVYLKNKKNNLNKTFGVLCLSITIWSFFYFLWQLSATEKSALFLTRALMAGSIFIPVTYLHFILVFLGLDQEKKNLIISGYILSFIFQISNFTSFFVKNVAQELYFPYWPKPGIFFHPFLLMFFSYFGYGIYLLFKAYQETLGIKKAQIKYSLVASLIGVLGGSTTYFLWYDIPIPPFGNVLVVLYVILTAYAITKYHLFDIKLILTELLVGIFSTLLFIQIFLSNSLWQYLWNIIVFIVFLFFGSLFITSILKEIAIKLKIGEASWKVLEQGEIVSENFKKVMTDKEKLIKEWFLSDVNKELEVSALKNKIKEFEEKSKGIS